MDTPQRGPKKSWDFLVPGLLVTGAGGGGAAAGLLLRESGSFGPYRVAIVPRSEADPRIAFPWSSDAMSAVELQALGFDRAAFVLILLGLCLLGVGVGSAALLRLLRVSAQRRDRAIRGLVGASPRRLLGREILLEMPRVIGAGGIAAGLAIAGSHLLLQAWPGAVVSGAPHVALPMFSVAGGTLLVLLASGLPLLRVLRRGWLGDALAPHARTNPGLDQESAQMVFVTGQILLAVTLLYGAGLLITTEGRPGSEIELPQGAAPVNELVVLEVEAAHLSVAQRRERYHELMEQVQGIPTIVSAGLASQGSLGGRGTLDWVLIPVAGQLVGAQAEHHAVSPEWFDTLGVSVDGNTPGNGTVALNATMGRFVGLGGSGWETRAPQPMRLGGARGVDVQAAGLLMEDLPIASPGWDRLYRAYPFGQITSRAPPVVYLSFDEYPPERAELLIRTMGEEDTGNPQRFGYPSASEDQSWSELEMALLAAARRADLRASPPTRLAARLHGLGAAGRWFSTMAGILGGLAVAVAVLGVLGASQARARQRIAELGVRRALGGSRGRVVAGVIGKLGLPLSVAGWIGLGTAVAAGEALTAFLPQAPAFDASLYLASVLVLAIGAVLGAMVPTLQASSIPPAQAMRLGEGIDGGDLA